MQNKKLSKNKSYDVAWDVFERAVYSRYRNQHLTYMMHQVANAIATARRAEMRKPPCFALYRREERATRC